MNPFQKHGIEHLSASSLNLARDNFPLWIVRYLGKVKGQQSVNMLAGIAVEEAVARGLDQTRHEVIKMLHGARSKWGIQNPNTLLDEIPPPSVQSLVLKEWNGNKYAGAAPEQKWLVEGAIPLGVPIILAAMGGVGKSFLTLDLALHVSMTNNAMSFPYRVFGGELKEHGTAVILAAEDSYETIHRRFNKIDEHEKRIVAGENLLVVPMPSIGGPRPLIDVEAGVPAKTEFFHDFKAQLMELKDLKLIVIDPLQAFIMADVTADPAAAQFMWSAFAEICAETGATMIVTHHMRKDGMKLLSNQLLTRP